MAIVNLTQDDLIAFEDRVADAFNDAKIPAQFICIQIMSRK